MPQINTPKWEAWNKLPEAVRTGKVAFALAHDGLDVHQVTACPSLCQYQHLIGQHLMGVH